MEPILRKCAICDEPIPEGRLRALPYTRTCVRHSKEERSYANPIVNPEGDLLDFEIIKDPEIVKELVRLKNSSIDSQ